MEQFLSVILSSGLSFFGYKLNINLTPRKSGPCTNFNDTVFSLPNSKNLCPSVDTKKYELIYFNPLSNPISSNFLSLYAPKSQPDLAGHYGVLPRGNDSVSASVQQFSVYLKGKEQTTYCTMVPAAETTKAGTLDVYYESAPKKNPVNFCPQTFVKSGAPNDVYFASAVALPVNSNKTDADASTILWVVPGASSGPLGSWPSVLEASDTTDGLANVLYVIAKYDVIIYLELGGAKGGDVNIYSSGLDSIGLPALTGSYLGGEGGIVYGLYKLSANDVLKVYLGAEGQEIVNTTGQSPYDGNGQGGLGTIFGGANGGGASYAYHYRYAAFGSDNIFDNVLEAAMDSKMATQVCVSAGGGGASRNASGGSGSFNNSTLSYGQDVSIADGHKRKPWGSAGGISYLMGRAAEIPGIKTNDLSGGGGTLTAGGYSKVPDQYPTKYSSCGQKLQPFQNSGGGSVLTNMGSGGGGGGGGIFGGGSGGWNGMPKPNNVHGAGGGGCSSFGLLGNSTRGLNGNLNFYRNSDWVTDNGYMVIGLPISPS